MMEIFIAWYVTEDHTAMVLLLNALNVQMGKARLSKEAPVLQIVPSVRNNN